MKKLVLGLISLVLISCQNKDKELINYQSNLTIKQLIEFAKKHPIIKDQIKQ